MLSDDRGVLTVPELLWNALHRKLVREQSSV